MSPLARLPTYSAYLAVAYRDLMASLGIVRAPCPSITSAVSIGQPRDLSPAADALGMGKSISNEDEGTARFRKEQEQEKEKEQPYCHAYNLILTGRWMMAVPRSGARFDKNVSVNGLGERMSKKQACSACMH